jgi:hypothetical protein
MGVLVKQRHINLYRKYTEQLIADLGSPVILVFDNIQSQCNNCVYDVVHKCSSGTYNKTGPKVFANGICPICKGSGTIKTERRETITCTVNWVNLTETDDEKVISVGSEDQNYFKIKTKVAYYNNLKTASYAIIDGFRARYVNCIQRGLKGNVTCIAYFKKDV